jgi:hypothetical protein
MRVAALMCTLAAVACPPGGARARTPTTPVHRLVGIAPNFLPPASDRAGRAQAFARIRAVGAGAARIDANWAQIETHPGVYDFRALDSQVKELVANRLQPMIILDYGNPLYSGAGSAAAQSGFSGVPPFNIGSPIYYPPDSPAPFARFAAALAGHYRHLVQRLEVWNEENLGWRFWEPHEDPAAYAALLKATYRAVKQVVPKDRVAVGGTFYPAVDSASARAQGIPMPAGTTPADLALPHQGTLEFLQQAFAAAPDLGRYFDAVAYHPYHFPYLAPEVDIPVEGTTESSMLALRRLLDAHGQRAKPIWITEVGWPNNTSDYGSTPRKSASFLVRTYATAWAHDIQTVFWYCYGDGSDWQVNQESAFGIVNSAGQPKPAFYAWQTLDRLLSRLRFTRPVAAKLRLPADGHALQFADLRHTVTVVWLAPETMSSDQGPVAPADQRASIITPRGTTQILDMTGHRLPVRRTFEASPYPVYLVRVGRAGSERGRRTPRRGPRPRPPSRRPTEQA